MPKFFAKVSRGLQETLSQELIEMGIERPHVRDGGVAFESNWETCLKAQLWSRTASRFLLPVLDFPAYQPDDVYHNVKKHDFTKYISPTQTIAVNAKVRESKLWDQRIVALKAKDAVVDQFRTKFNRRPDVDKDRPDLRLVISVLRNEARVSLDLSGDTLSLRGYRPEAGEAPLRETVAAGLVRLSGWQPNMTLLDPMCGSGTILIEAALAAIKTPSFLAQRKFSFERWRSLQLDSWINLRQTAFQRALLKDDIKIYGSDIDPITIKLARENVNRAQVNRIVELSALNLKKLEPPSETGMIITNPPYGERLGEIEELKELYFQFGKVLKKKFKGWQCWLLSGNPELSKHMELKASQKIPIYNGPIECRFLKYEVF